MITADARAAAAAGVPFTRRAAGMRPAARHASIAAAFFKRDLLTDVSYRLSLALHALHILSGVAAYYFLARFVDRGALSGVAPFPFLVAGLAMNAYMSAWLVCFTDAIRAGQTTGTLKVIFASPLSNVALLACSAIYPCVRASIEASVYIFGGWALGASLAGVDVVALAAIVFLSSLAFAAIGIASAAFSLALKRGDPVLWLVTSLSWMLGGVLYPTSLLPASLEQAGRLLPITHAAHGLRVALGSGRAGESIAGPAVALGAFAIIALPASIAAFGAALRTARRAGTLGHV